MVNTINLMVLIGGCAVSNINIFEILTLLIPYDTKTENIMKMKFMLMNTVAISALVLTGCNTTDIQATMGNGNAVSTTANRHIKPTSPEQVKIYHAKSEMPKQRTVIGRVSASNYNMVGMTISQESIMSELKKQAASIGANGLTHISTGLAQTTAEAILVK